MINVYPANSRYSSDHGWLKTTHSFSFANYYDANNIRFGPLRVLNDDMVAPSQGFGAHPHREMEIVSLVLKGALEHQDSTGTKEIMHFGQLQRMSAGTGVVHSEMNPSNHEDVHFLQMWFLPEKAGLKPSYEQVTYDPNQMKNALLPIVSSQLRGQHIAYIHQDLTIYLAQLEPTKQLYFAQKPNRRIFLFVLEGELTLNQKTTLKKRDSARITNTATLNLATEQGAFFLAMDLP